MGHLLGSTRIWGSWRLPLYPKSACPTVVNLAPGPHIERILAFYLHDSDLSSSGEAFPLPACFAGILAVVDSHTQQGSRGCFIVGGADPLGGSAYTMKLVSPTWNWG